MVYQNNNPISNLLPGFPTKLLKNGSVVSESAAQLIADNPRVAATGTITITGTIAANDELEINIYLPAFPGGVISKTIMLVGGDTTTTAAQKVAAALSTDPTLQAYGAFATSLLNVITFYFPGPVGNFVTLTESVPTGAEGIALGNGGALAGGSGAVIPYNTFNYNYKGTNFFAFQAGKPVLLGLNVITALVAEGREIQ